MFNYNIEEISCLKKKNNEDQNEDSIPTYEEFFDRLINALYSWHDNITSEIEENDYLRDIENMEINLKSYKELVVSLVVYKEILCETSGLTYIRETETKYTILDVYNIINNLINEKKKIKRGAVMLFSILLFQTLEEKQEFNINLNQITNKIHPVISMIFYNELQKQIKDLGLKTGNNFVIDNINAFVTKIKEDFVKNSIIR